MLRPIFFQNRRHLNIIRNCFIKSGKEVWYSNAGLNIIPPASTRNLYGMPQEAYLHKTTSEIELSANFVNVCLLDISKSPKN